MNHNKRVPSWDDYRYFLAVARLGSLSAAARSLAVTQPTVGRRIEQLETMLRCPLFNRQPSGFSLTPSGMVVLGHVEHMERETLAVESALSSAGEEGNQLVRIATTSTLALNWLVDRVADYAHVDPSLRLAIKTGIIFTDVRRFEADIALRIGDPGEEALFGRRIGTLHCGLYATHEYLEQHGEPTSAAELAEHAIIESEGEIEHLRQAEVLRNLADFSNFPFAADNTSVQLAACLAGCGIAAQMCLVADAQPRLKRLLATDFDVTLDLWLLMSREIRNRRAVRTVFDYLAREAEAHAAQFEGRPQG